MPLAIYNTLSGREEDFVPLREDTVRMYACGVTVYDRCHVGHARSLLVFDVIHRYLRHLGYDVRFVRNITDLDDKIIRRAQEEGTTAEVIAERYIEEFRNDSAALGLLPPQHEPKATDHVPEIIDLVQRLIERGLAYPVDGDVFFSVTRFPGYGKLSRRRLEELVAGARVEVDARKQHPMDFALWKASKPGEPSWNSPWGPGRPGWHVECSAMSVKYLGQPFDIHGGGQDLIFPHHENEIAQSEGAAGVPLARYWIHNGFVNIDHEKMSKSLGNVYTIAEVLGRYDASVLRHFLLSSHYRSPLDFSAEGLEEAEKAVERLYETLERAERAVPDDGSPDPDAAVLEEFRRAMDNDFNTPQAMAVIFDEVRNINRLLDEGESKTIASRRGALELTGGVLGLIQGRPYTFFTKKRERWMRDQGLSPESIEELIRQRDEARRAKRWQEADRIRAELNKKGITLEDTPGGTVWRVR